MLINRPIIIVFLILTFLIGKNFGTGSKRPVASLLAEEEEEKEIGKAPSLLQKGELAPSLLEPTIDSDVNLNILNEGRRAGTWLDSSIIDAYLERIVSSGRPVLEFVPNFIIDMYRANKKEHAEEIANWIIKIDWTEIQLLFLPVFLEPNHWAMAVYEPRNQQFSMFDSKIALGRVNEKVAFMEEMADFFADIAQIHGQVFDKNVHVVGTNVPQQDNDSDCGVFALMFAYYIGKERRILDNFNHCNMNAKAFREKIYQDIYAIKFGDHGGTHQDDSDKNPTKPKRKMPESLLSGDPNQPRGGEMPQSLFSPQELPQFPQGMESIPASPSIKWHEIDTFLEQNRQAEIPPGTPQSRQRNEESHAHGEGQLAPSLLREGQLAPTHERHLAPSLLQAGQLAPTHERHLAPSLLQAGQLAPTHERHLAPSLLQAGQLAPSLLQQRQLAPSLLQQEQIGGHEETALSIENLLEVLEPDHDISPSIINAYLHMITNGAPEFGVIPLDVIVYFQQNEDELKPEWLEEISHEMLVDTALLWFIPAFLTNRQVVLSALDVQKNTLILYDSENPGILSDEKHLFIKMLLRFLSKLYQNNKILETAWLDRILVPRHEKRQDSGIFIMEIAEEIIAQRSVHAHLQLEKELVLVYRKEIFGKLKSIFLMKGKPASQKLLPSIQKQLMIGTISRERIKSIKKEADYSKIAFKDILAICKSAAGEDLSAPVIDAYLHMITNGAPEFGVIPLEVISHFQQNEGELKPEWLERISHEMLDTVLLWFIPGILTTNNQQQHFALTALDVQKNTIFSFDPKSPGIYSESKELLKATILRFLKKLYQSKNMEFKSETTDWSDRFHLPKIVDIADSGIFLAIFADQILRQRSIHAHLEAKKEDVEYYRQKICLNLQENKFTLRMGSNKRRPQSVVTIPPIHKSLQIGGPSQTDRSIGFKPPKKVPSLVEGLMPPPSGKVPSLMEQAMPPPSGKVPSLMEQAMPPPSGKVPSLMEQAMPPPSGKVPSLMEQAMQPPSGKVPSLMEQAMPPPSGKVPSLMEQAMPPPSGKVPSLMEKSTNILKLKRITLKFKEEYSEIIKHRRELTQTIVDEYVQQNEEPLKNSESTFIPMAANFANYSTVKGFLKTHWGAIMKRERVERIKYWLKIALLNHRHWVLAVMNVEKKILTLYDPLSPEGTEEKIKFCQELLQTLHSLYTARGLSLDEIRTENFTFVRNILNENDSGVFLMMLAQSTIKMRREIDFKHLAGDDESIRKFRWKIYADLSAQTFFEMDDLFRELNVREVENYLDKIVRQNLDSMFIPVDVLTTEDVETNSWLNESIPVMIKNKIWYIPAIINKDSWVLAVLNRKTEKNVLTLYDPINPGIETREKRELREKIFNLFLKIYNVKKAIKIEDITWREEDRISRMTNYTGNTGVCTMTIVKMISNGEDDDGFKCEQNEEQMMENRLKIFAEITKKFHTAERSHFHLTGSLKPSKKELATSLLAPKEMESTRPPQKGWAKSLVEEGMELKYAKSLIEPQKGLLKSLAEPIKESSNIKVDFGMQPEEESFGIAGREHRAKYEEVPSSPSIKWDEIDKHLADTAESQMKSSKGEERQSLDINMQTTAGHATGIPAYATSLLEPKSGMAKSLVETDIDMQPEYAKSLHQGQKGLAKSLIKSKGVVDSKYAVSILKSSKSEGKQKMYPKKAINLDSDDDDDVVEISEIQKTQRKDVVTTEVHQNLLLFDDIGELLDGKKEVRGNVIDAYLEMLTGNRENYGYIPAYVIFYFDREGIAQRWLDGLTPAIMNTVTHWFMPARLNSNHWVLAVFQLGINTIYFYDSLNALISVEVKESFKNLMVRFFNDLHVKMELGRREIRADNFWWLDIKKIRGIPLPQQNNAIDCGVFVMMYAKDIIEQDNLFGEIHVQQAKIKECRQLVHDELMNFRSSLSDLRTNLQMASKTIEKTIDESAQKQRMAKSLIESKGGMETEYATSLLEPKKGMAKSLIESKGGMEREYATSLLEPKSGMAKSLIESKGGMEPEYATSLLEPKSGMAKSLIESKGGMEPEYATSLLEPKSGMAKSLVETDIGMQPELGEHLHIKNDDDNDDDIISEEGNKKRTKKYYLDYYQQKWDFVTKCENHEEQLEFCAKNWLVRKGFKANYVHYRCRLSGCLYEALHFEDDGRVYKMGEHNHKLTLDTIDEEDGESASDDGKKNKELRSASKYANLLNETDELDDKIIQEYLEIIANKNPALNIIPKRVNLETSLRSTPSLAWVQRLTYEHIFKTKYFLKTLLYGTHWIFFLLNRKENELIIYDPINPGEKSDEKTLLEGMFLNFMKNVYIVKALKFDMSKMKVRYPTYVQKLKNPNNAGVYLLMLIKNIAKNKGDALWINEADIMKYRKEIYDDFSTNYQFDFTETGKKTRKRKGQATSLIRSEHVMDGKKSMAKSLIESKGGMETEYATSLLEPKKGMAKSLIESKGGMEPEYATSLLEPKKGMAKSLIESKGGMETEYATSLLEPKKGMAKSLIETKGGMEPEYATSLLEPKKGMTKSMTDFGMHPKEENIGIFGREEVPASPSIKWDEIDKHLADTAESQLRKERQSLDLNLPFSIADEKSELEIKQPRGGLKRSSISLDPQVGEKQSSVGHDEHITSATRQRLSQLQISSSISGHGKSIQAGINTKDTQMGKLPKSSGGSEVAAQGRKSAFATSIAHSLSSSLIPSTPTMSQGHHPPLSLHGEQAHLEHHPPSSLLEEHQPPSSLLEPDHSTHQIGRPALEGSRKKKSKEKAKSLLDKDRN